jgi:hypothetical protein
MGIHQVIEQGDATPAEAAMTLRSAFQIAAIWSIVLAELCYLGGPAAKAYIASATIVAAIRDDRLRIGELTATDIAAANMVVGATEQIWLANDAMRRIRYPDSVSDIQIMDALFIEHLSENEIANDPSGHWRGPENRRPTGKYNVSLKTLQERRYRALKAVDDAFAGYCEGRSWGRLTMFGREPNAIPFSNDAMRTNLLRLQNEWETVQATRDRNAIYEYLAAVFELVECWGREGKAVKRAQRALHLRGYSAVREPEPFAAVIRCTSDPDKVDHRTQSKWSRALRYAAQFKDLDEKLRDFIKRKGGINKCADRYTHRHG